MQLGACCPQAVHAHEAEDHRVEDEEVREELVAFCGLFSLCRPGSGQMGRADRKDRDRSLPEPAGTRPQAWWLLISSEAVRDSEGRGS